MKVVIIDYGSGNLRSAAKAFAYAADDHDSAVEVVVSGVPDQIATADRLVLPGVGAFAAGKAGLEAVDGLHDALNEAVIAKGRPFFGICVGMQLMADVGHEFGDTPGLGWIAGQVSEIKPHDHTLKIPHMGWNDLHLLGAHPLFAGVKSGEHAYFVHSYAFCADNETDVLAQVDYAGPVTAAIGRDNMFGTQFHPEKSQAVGLKIIANFLRWKP